jgi:hypothetical protein
MVVRTKKMLVLACMLLMVISAAHVSAAVTWTDTLSDPAGDVKDTSLNVVTGHDEIDILSVTMSPQGTDLNVTMTLAGAYNSSAIYKVTLEADGSKDYSLSRMFFIGFTVTGPTGNMIGTKGYYSADGKKLSWIIAKANVTATTNLKIKDATTFLTDSTTLKTYMDTASVAVGPGPGTGPEPDTGPQHIEILYEMVTATHLKVTMTSYLGTNDSKIARMNFDKNSDGTVTQAEKDTAVALINQRMNGSGGSNMTLDGVKPNASTFNIDYTNSVGSVNATTKVTMVMITDLTYPDVPSAGKHTYATPSSNQSSNGSGFGNVTTDSSYVMKAPSGWRFVKSEWPTAYQSFFDSSGRTVTISGKDFKTAFAVKGPNSYSIESTGGGGGGKKKTPGMGAPLALMALAGLAAAMVLGRRRE